MTIENMEFKDSSTIIRSVQNTIKKVFQVFLIQLKKSD